MPELQLRRGLMGFVATEYAFSSTTQDFHGQTQESILYMSSLYQSKERQNFSVHNF
jgi:hypothetical protein